MSYLKEEGNAMMLNSLEDVPHSLSLPAKICITYNADLLNKTGLDLFKIQLNDQSIHSTEEV